MSGSREDWIKQQQRIAASIIDTDDVPWRLDGADRDGLPPRLERVGGLDISFVESPPATADDADLSAEHEPGATGPGVAALVVVSYPDLTVMYEDFEPVDLSIPYQAGFLGFREADAYGKLLARAQGTPHNPQVLLVDGCGMLHPRGCGSACHVGVVCGYPAVGVAKNLLVVDGLDRFEVRRQLQEASEAARREAPRAGGDPFGCHADAGGSGGAAGPKGAAAVAAAASSPRDVQVPLIGASGVVHGVALCPGVTKKPIYISIGHRLSLPTSSELVRRCCRHRIPEPIRQADLRSRQWVREHFPPAAATGAARAGAGAVT